MNKRQAVFMAAKIVFAAAVLAWLFHKVDASRIWAGIRDARRTPIAAGILLCWLTLLIAGWRWQRLLAAFDIAIPLKSLLCIAQIGQFFMMFLPGPVGDDLTRMLYISRMAKARAAEACTTVLLDRLIGLTSILVLAVLCIPSQWGALSTSAPAHGLALAVLASGVAVCVLGAVFFLAGHPTHKWFEHCLRSLPATNFRDELARIWGVLCVNKRRVATVLAAALVTQSLLCVVFYLGGRAVGIDVPLLTWVSFVPIVLAANAVPITLAGLGVREYLLVLFLGIVGRVRIETALAASFVTFSMTFVVCLFGGVVYIFFRSKKERVGHSSVALQ